MLIQRVRIPAISDLKEAWIGKIKSAFQRDQLTEEEKRLTFADPMTQYCGLRISVALQYYHARKRSEETPLDYLYRLNVAALRAKLKVKDRNAKAPREHVDHYIETLGGPQLADRLTLRRLTDVDELEEVLCAREKAKSRQRRSAFGSKYRQKSPVSAPAAPAWAIVRAIQAQDPGSESEGVSGSDRSDSEGQLRRSFVTAAVAKLIGTARCTSLGHSTCDPSTISGFRIRRGLEIGQIRLGRLNSEEFRHCGSSEVDRHWGASQQPDPARVRAKAPEGSRIPERRAPGDRDHQEREHCSHYGSRKHTDLDCWKRLTCDKCGKRGHPTDRYLYACRECGDVHEAGECPMKEFYNQILKWYDPTRHAGWFPEQVGKMLGRSPGWNPRSKYCIYSYVNKATPDRGRKESDLRGNTCNLYSYATKIVSHPRIGEFSRSDAELALDLKRGESRGYWKRHSPGKWFRQAKISGRINPEKAILLLDTGAKGGCHFDTSQRQECVEIGDNVYTTEGRTRIKFTLAEYMVYFFDIWIGDLSGQNAILGMNSMVPAGVRMDLADGSMRIPDEVRIPLNDRKRLYGEKKKRWVTRVKRWVPTVSEGPGRIRYLVISNIEEKILRLNQRLDVGMILDQDKVPRSPGFVSVGSRRYREWQNRALESTKPRKVLKSQQYIDQRTPNTIATLTCRNFRHQTGSCVDIDPRDSITGGNGQPSPDRGKSSQSGKGPSAYTTTTPNADRSRSCDAGISESVSDQAPYRTGTNDIESKTGNPNCHTGIKPASGEDFGENTQIHPTEGIVLRDPSANETAAIAPQDTEDDYEIYYHESGDLSDEDLAGNLAVLPEIPISTIAKVSFKDLEQHLLIGKGNALPQATRGVVCDIDVGNVKEIVLPIRNVPIRFREKVEGLIKGPLAAKIIRLRRRHGPHR
ncbi:hypothetical protein PHMEG_00016124 [Phytophthora megakarya]|uniref:Eukaryotic/viral aspartic protease n=1 Tax=Phytophthora megakarya TaxID=4795 RepID=A0A225W145_9STRA|nr:hypothetical protein PHMEG_00016124 [Phytophthora megakarya]